MSLPTVEKDETKKSKGSGKTPVVLIPASVGTSTEKGVKRKKVANVPDPIAVAPIGSGGNTILYRPRSRLPLKSPVPPPASSPSYDVVDLSSTSPQFSDAPLPSSSSVLDVPPSTLGASSSSSSIFSSSSQSFEIAILRSQLDAANNNLRREKELSQQERARFERERRELEEQFDKERKAYVEYIRILESRR
jgi:hypothetical protein